MRRGAGLAACVVITALALAAQTQAAPRSFFGVVPQAELERADYERMAEGRVGTLRVPLPWASIDRTPEPGDLDWSDFDRTVANSAELGIAVLPTVYGVPIWVSGPEGCLPKSCMTTPPRTEEGLTAWRAFLREAVRRYGPGGGFWAERPELPARPIRVWQIWNEQNSSGFYEPRPRVSGYATLFTAASEAIRGEDPGAELILGGMYGTPPGRTAIDAPVYLRRLYRQPGFAAAFDGISVHPYAGGIAEVKAQIDRLARVARAAGDRDVDLWITEIGWASGGDPNRLVRGPRGQASRLEQAFGYLTRNRRRLRIRLVAWFAWRDVPFEESRCGFCARTGLFSESLRPKPAWHSFVSFTGGR